MKFILMTNLKEMNVPDVNVDVVLVACPSLPLFVSEIQRLVLEGYDIDMERDWPTENGILWQCSMVRTSESRNQADRALAARASRKSREAAERAYQVLLKSIASGEITAEDIPLELPTEENKQK